MHLAATPDERRLSRLADAARFIADADLLLFRRPVGSLISRAISVAGRSEYTHAAKAVWWRPPCADSASIHPILLCCEVREFYGGRAVTLASQVRKFPGLIDVFSCDTRRFCEYNRAAATAWMLDLAGSRYGYRAVLHAGLAHAPIARWFVKPDTLDTANDHSPVFCSEAVSEADRLGGGVDPVPHLSDRATEPGDLARSDFYQYRFTLIP